MYFALVTELKTVLAIVTQLIMRCIFTEIDKLCNFDDRNGGMAKSSHFLLSQVLDD